MEVEPVLQDITGEELNRGANTASDERLDIYNIYLAGFLITLSPNGPFASAKVAIVKTKNATIAFFSFSPFLFLRYYDFGASQA